MTIENLQKNLSKRGYNAQIRLLTGDRKSVFVYHDYEGPYPNKDVFAIHDAATAYATKHGFQSEQRGHYTATMIY